MRILITGATGFAGTALVQDLAKAGHRVYAAARHPEKIIPALDITPLRLPDLARDFDAQALIGDCDAVIHAAALAHATSQIADSEYDRVNRSATAALAQAAKIKNVKKFVFISSIRAQCGPATDIVQTEKTQPEPSDAYGHSKLEAENTVSNAGIPFTIFRPVVMYGQGVKANIARLQQLAASPWPLPFASLRQPRSLLALDNLVSAVRFALQSPTTNGETFVLADETPLSLAAILLVLRNAQGKNPRLFHVSPMIFEIAFKAVGREDIWLRLGGKLVADASKLRAAGWKPSTDSPAGLAAMVQAASP